ncbi:MAG: FliA/WhiG family RNA polymerase sigma factor [Nitrospirae bacterium]|nr:MAG: FliA/WhiG family RNA polymerase sigma factor [Nitrospirota bacterium]
MDLIQAYLAEGSGRPVELRNQLILEYAPQIKYIAHRVASRLPSHIELEELINAGVLGLIDAIEKFDLSRNIQFKTYAEIRVRGAMLDELRAQDWVPRSVRQKINTLARAYARLEQMYGRPATSEEVAAELGLTVEELTILESKAQGLPLISLNDHFDRDDDDDRCLQDSVPDEESPDPLEQLDEKWVKEVIERELDLIPPRERTVLSLYYFDELTMKEIGVVLGVTESRISQIHTKALLRLKGALEAAGVDVPA